MVLRVSDGRVREHDHSGTSPHTLQGRKKETLDQYMIEGFRTGYHPGKSPQGEECQGG